MSVIDLELFGLTLGKPYLLLIVLILAGALFDRQKTRTRWRRAALSIFWCTLVGLLINLLYIDVPYRIAAFLFATFFGVFLIRVCD